MLNDRLMASSKEDIRQKYGNFIRKVIVKFEECSTAKVIARLLNFYKIIKGHCPQFYMQ